MKGGILHKLIEEIFHTFSNHYTKVGDYSSTEIISPPRIVKLRNKYPECEKVISMVQSTASLIGSGVHKYVENLLTPYAHKYSLEKRITYDLLGKQISGTYDILVDNKHVFDIKTSKIWKLIFDPEMTEWIEQQNIYAFLLHKAGINIESLNIMAVYLDWQEGMVVRSNKYPKEPIQIYPLPVWPVEQTEEFIVEKLKTHMQCEEMEDDDLPACTPEERWERFPEGVTEKFAVMKAPDAKRALRVFTTKADAKKYCKTATGLTSASYIEIRYAQRVRCERYCKVNVKCNHYKTYMEDKKNDALYDKVPIALVLNGRW